MAIDRRSLAAPDSGAGGVRPAPLPAANVDIRILRTEARLLLPRATRIVCAPTPPPSPGPDPDRLRLRVVDELFCDEMILVYGRPLCWTGELSANRERIPHVERVFGEVFTLDSQHLEVVTPRPELRFPDGHDRVAWSYGAVLVRGDDPPWAGSGLVHIDRLGA